MSRKLDIERSQVHVLPEWSGADVATVFGFTGGGDAYSLYGGIPRLLEASKQESSENGHKNRAEELVAEAVKLLDPIFQGIRLSEKEKLGHRVLLLDDAGDPKAFLTPFVAKLVYAKYKAKIFGKSKALVQALSNISWAGSMVGMFFEPAFHDHVAHTDRKITVLGHDINILHRGNVGPQQLNANHKSQPPVALDTLYLPGTRVNDTFDSYILAQVLTKVVLHLIQVTVGTDHTGGTWDKSVKKVYDTAKNAYPNLDIVMVYAVPKSVVESFKVKPMSNVGKKNLTYVAIPATFDFLEADI